MWNLQFLHFNAYLLCFKCTKYIYICMYVNYFIFKASLNDKKVYYVLKYCFIFLKKHNISLNLMIWNFFNLIEIIDIICLSVYQSGAACWTSLPHIRPVSSRPVDRPSVRKQRRRLATTSADECSNDERRKWIATNLCGTTDRRTSHLRSVRSCLRAKNICEIHSCLNLRWTRAELNFYKTLLRKYEPATHKYSHGKYLHK